jgi:tRNA pseudouridine38-40 synthase
MQTAAGYLVGTHDFRCFETQFPNKATSVRTVESARLTRHAGWPVWVGFDFAAGVAANSLADEFLCFEIAADGFLYKMVRAIVGTLVDVGRGRFAPADVARMIAEGDRSLAGPTAPPQGLFLVSVDYDPGNLRPKFVGDS